MAFGRQIIQKNCWWRLPEVKPNRTDVGHARYDDLQDLEDVLAAIRKLPGISEPTAGTFYFRRKPFLHFHTKDGMRWADAKVGDSWGSEIQIPLNCAQREKTRFLREIRSRYEACSSASIPGRGRRGRAV